MKTRSRSREEKSLGVNVESLLEQCETELYELREELEREKRTLTELKDAQIRQHEQAARQNDGFVSREDHEMVERVASELRETCRTLSLDNKELREKHSTDVMEKERLTGIVTVQREQSEQSKKRDEIITMNMKTLSHKIEEQQSQLRSLEGDLATMKETLRLKDQELVASYGEYSKVDNERATLNIRVQELMYHNANLTAMMFPNRPIN